MWFEDDNEVLQATTLPPVVTGRGTREAWLSIGDGGALNFFRRQLLLWFVGRVLRTLVILVTP